MPRIERTITIGADPTRVQAVITDYRRYPEFVPNMESVEIVHTEGETQRVRFTLNLIIRISYTLDLTARDDGIDWTLVDGPFNRNDGSWRLKDLGAGRTHATYSIDVELKGYLPRFLEERLIAQSLPATLRAFRDAAEAPG